MNPTAEAVATFLDILEREGGVGLRVGEDDWSLLVGNACRRLRRDCDLTQKQVAGQCGIIQSTLSDFERGKRELKSGDFFALIGYLSMYAKGWRPE